MSESVERGSFSAERVARRAGWGVESGDATMKVCADDRATRPPSAAADHTPSGAPRHLPQQSWGRKSPTARTVGSILFRFVPAPCAAAVLVSAVAAQEPPIAPPLSPGWQFAEQGGAAIYAGVCAACHQSDAKGATGAGAYPALASNPELASADDLLRILLRGLRGMPPVGGMMSDQQVADVANYVRTHFGNDYRDALSAADVRAARPPSR